jgi:ATP-dependent RNA helicase RhlE
LILAPTRELATQIDDEIQGFAYHAPVASAAVYGGVPMGPQERALKAGVDIVVATPGRLLDHMRSSVGDYSALEIFVLDEADRMMDMGFWPDVRKIAEALPPTTSRQTMLFSATMPEEVMRFAHALAPTAVFVQVGSRRGPAKTITHEARILPSREKSTFLAKYLRRHGESAIVFVNTKIGCDRLARQLASTGLRAAAVHADRSQEDRTRTLESFRTGRVKVLVATDVAARGLDIEDVALIVNYEVPRGLDSYVHRVGRTGRNESTGHALTLADPAERRDLELVEKAFGLKLIDEISPRHHDPGRPRSPSAPQSQPRVRGGHRPHAGARHRRELDHLQHAARRAPAPAAVRTPRRARRALGIEPSAGTGTGRCRRRHVP